MALCSGDKLGSHEILGPLGAGGMGEVYRARDIRLDREVAIKVLPELLAHDPGRLARFEREAKVLASLNHPNIAQIYGLEDAGGVRALVMELVPGETLHGPLPLGTALGYAKQIASALEVAHEKGIVHRDLKPANLMVTPAGVVKVLDFGLAALEREPASGNTDSASSPTVTIQATEAGAILGSAGYMAPEQARGLPTDKRADIWAFGVVLYEMLTGKSPFGGATISDSLAAILTREPDLSLVPETVRRLLRRCLVKDPRERLRGIGDWAELLVEAPQAAEKQARSKLPWTVSVLLAVALGAALIWFATRPAVPEMRVDIVTPPTPFPGSFALPPDGRKIAYTASIEGLSRLWLRSLDSTVAQVLPGTEGANAPFWSPDSRSLGFFAESKLKRIDLNGSQPQTLAETALAYTQGAWSEEGVILFCEGGVLSGPLIRVPALGGRKALATPSSKGPQRAPRFLPGGRQFLYIVNDAAPAMWLGSLDGSPPRKIVEIEGATDSQAEYLAPGWLVRVRRNVLVAQRFDGNGGLTGEPVPLVERGVAVDLTMAGSFSVSRNGVLSWRNGKSGSRQLQWFDRTGRNLGPFAEPDEFLIYNPELSPDGERVAITLGPTGSSDIWIREATRSSRFTFDPADDRFTIWSPDGKQVVFASSRRGNFDLYWKPADGSGKEELILSSPEPKRPNSWSSDGRYILYTSGQYVGDLMVLPLTGDRKPFTFLSSPFNKQQAIFSPDGKWVAYQSNESGRIEVYVRPFPGPGAQVQISNEGGRSPRWRADGKELYYVAPNNKLMAAAVGERGGMFAARTPAVLFQTQIVQSTNRQQYDVTPDGKFLVNAELTGTSSEPIHLLLNWVPPK